MLTILKRNFYAFLNRKNANLISQFLWNSLVFLFFFFVLVIYIQFNDKKENGLSNKLVQEQKKIFFFIKVFDTTCYLSFILIIFSFEFLSNFYVFLV